MSDGIYVEGLREFTGALKRIDHELVDALKRAHKVIADEAAQQSQRRARGMGGVRAKAAGKITGRASTDGALVGVPSGIGAVAFWGAKRHTGWYAAPRFSESPRQHPEWVGNSWEAGVAGQGPYAINDAIASYLPRLMEDFERMVDEATAQAFPEK